MNTRAATYLVLAFLVLWTYGCAAWLVMAVYPVSETGPLSLANAVPNAGIDAVVVQACTAEHEDDTGEVLYAAARIDGTVYYACYDMPGEDADVHLVTETGEEASREVELLRAHGAAPWSMHAVSGDRYLDRAIGMTFILVVAFFYHRWERRGRWRGLFRFLWAGMALYQVGMGLEAIFDADPSGIVIRAGFVAVLVLAWAGGRAFVHPQVVHEVPTRASGAQGDHHQAVNPRSSRSSTNTGRYGSRRARRRRQQRAAARRRAPEHSLNINTATVEEIAALPGVNAIQAQRVIARREELGAFSDVSQFTSVLNVDGELRDRIEEMVVAGARPRKQDQQAGRTLDF